MNGDIKQILLEAASLKSQLAADPAFVEGVVQSCNILADCVVRGGTIYACGNGGSTCDAMHLVEELVAKYKRERRGIRAQHLMDPSVMTCWGNDHSFEDCYRRSVEVFCRENDVLVAISTSGNSSNVLAAVEQAKSQGTKVIGLTGRTGGELLQQSDVALVVPSQLTERIQEAHITIVHIWLELLETRYPEVLKPERTSHQSGSSDGIYERPSAVLV